MLLRIGGNKSRDFKYLYHANTLAGRDMSARRLNKHGGRSYVRSRSWLALRQVSRSMTCGILMHTPSCPLTRLAFEGISMLIRECRDRKVELREGKANRDSPHLVCRQGGHGCFLMFGVRHMGDAKMPPELRTGQE